MNLEMYIDSWIIQDGNYPNFCQGEKQNFALEAWTEKHEKTETRNKQMTKVGHAQYKLVSEIIWQDEQATIIDCGVLAYIEMDLTKQYKVGDYIIGNFTFGIDYYYYFETLSKVKEIPTLIYSWEIQDIALNQAPFIKEQQGKIEVMTRDASKVKFASIPRMNAWEDDGGYANYLLKIKQLSPLPTLTK